MFNPFKKRKKVSKEADKSSGGGEARNKPAELLSAEAALSSSKDKRRVIGVILHPHLTEKTSFAGRGGWYAFIVGPRSSKPLVKRAVEDRYGVRVEKVSIINQPSKSMRLGRIQGRVPGFKKAMVKVKEGQSIEFT